MNESRPRTRSSWKDPVAWLWDRPARTFDTEEPTCWRGHVQKPCRYDDGGSYCYTHSSYVDCSDRPCSECVAEDRLYGVS